MIQQIGFWMSHVTLQGLIEERSDGDTLAITALFAALFAPALFVGPFGGVLADRVERKLVVTSSYYASGASAAGLALLAGISSAPPLWAIYTLAFVLGTTFSLLGPSAGALVVNSVSSDAVQSAISLQAAVQNLTRVVGPIMAVEVIGSGRFHIGFSGFAVASALAGLMITRVAVDAHDVEMDGLGVLARIRDGFRHARERRPALLAVSTTAVTSIFGVAHTALVPSFTREVLELEAGQFAKIVAATGVGAIVGALTVGYSKVEPSLRRAAISLLVYGVCLVGFTSAEQLNTAMAWQLGVGFLLFHHHDHTADTVAAARVRLGAGPGHVAVRDLLGRSRLDRHAHPRDHGRLRRPELRSETDPADRFGGDHQLRACRHLGLQGDADRLALPGIVRLPLPRGRA